eukprot:2653978-Prymnesium_polylepis.1
MQRFLARPARARLLALDDRPSERVVDQVCSGLLLVDLACARLHLGAPVPARPLVVEPRVAASNARNTSPSVGISNAFGGSGVPEAFDVPPPPRNIASARFWKAWRVRSSAGPVGGTD